MFFLNGGISGILIGCDAVRISLMGGLDLIKIIFYLLNGWGFFSFKKYLLNVFVVLIISCSNFEDLPLDIVNE